MNLYVYYFLVILTWFLKDLFLTSPNKIPTSRFDIFSPWCNILWLCATFPYSVIRQKPHQKLKIIGFSNVNGHNEFWSYLEMAPKKTVISSFDRYADRSLTPKIDLIYVF